MKNPFLIDDYLRLEASINKLMLLDTNILINNREIEEKSAFEIFSTEKIIEEIKKYSNELKLDTENILEKEFPIYLNKSLESDDVFIKETAEKIVGKFGKRLGVILFILKRGKSNNILERKDWNSDDWQYWKTIENVVLSGGLSSGKMGEYFKIHIESLFLDANIKPYNILLTQGSSNAGIVGASMYIKENNGSNLVFDFGQSFLKRSIVTFNNNSLIELKEMEKIESKYMELEYALSEEQSHDAKLLDEYLQKVIIDTYLDANKNKININSEISISIANYINKGKLLNRGGYGKLVLISDNYEEHLSNQIYTKTGKKFKFKIIHDGTAIAANFMNLPNTASISLGTAFGIGFPNTNKYNKSISEKICILKP